jgi:hypothetical protein
MTIREFEGGVHHMAHDSTRFVHVIKLEFDSVTISSIAAS